MPQKKVVFGSLVSPELIRLPEIMAVLIGLSIWKLLQLAWLSGGYLLARNIHLAMMVLHHRLPGAASTSRSNLSENVGLDGCEH